MNNSYQQGNQKNPNNMQYNSYNNQQGGQSQQYNQQQPNQQQRGQMQQGGQQGQYGQQGRGGQQGQGGYGQPNMYNNQMQQNQNNMMQQNQQRQNQQNQQGYLNQQGGQQNNMMNSQNPQGYNQAQQQQRNQMMGQQAQGGGMNQMNQMGGMQNQMGGQQNQMGGMQNQQQQNPMVNRYSGSSQYGQQNSYGQQGMPNNSYGHAQPAPLAPAGGGMGAGSGLVIQQPPATGLVLGTMGAPGTQGAYGQQSAAQQPLYLTQNSLSLPPPPQPHPLLAQAPAHTTTVLPGVAGNSYLAVQPGQPHLPSTTLLPQLSQHQQLPGLHTANSVGPLVVQQPTTVSALPIMVSSAGVPTLPTVTTVTNPLLQDPMQQQNAAAAANMAAQAAAAAAASAVSSSQAQQAQAQQAAATAALLASNPAALQAAALGMTAGQPPVHTSMAGMMPGQPPPGQPPHGLHGNPHHHLQPGAAQQQQLLQHMQMQQQKQQLKNMRQRLPHVSGAEMRTLQLQIADLQRQQQLQNLQTLRLAQKQEKQAFKYLNQAIKNRPSRTYQSLYTNKVLLGIPLKCIMYLLNTVLLDISWILCCLNSILLQSLCSLTTCSITYLFTYYQNTTYFL